MRRTSTLLPVSYWGTRHQIFRRFDEVEIKKTDEVVAIFCKQLGLTLIVEPEVISLCESHVRCTHLCLILTSQAHFGSL